MADNVARWKDELLPVYPQATFSFQPPWFYGALRDSDEVVRSSDLGHLIDKLLAREATAARHHDDDARNAG